MLHLEKLDSTTINSLKDGDYGFVIDGPYGTEQAIRLHLSGSLGKAWSIQWDLWTCEWDLGATPAVTGLVAENIEYRRTNNMPKRTPYPHAGKTTLTVSALREDAPTWLLKSMKVVTQQSNLVPVTDFPDGVSSGSSEG
jgi:hypothetical protein